MTAQRTSQLMIAAAECGQSPGLWTNKRSLAREQCTVSRVSDLVRVTRGVWRPASCVDDLASRAAAILTVMPEGSVLSGVTAALLHGLWLPPALALAPRVEVVVRPEVPEPTAHAGSRRVEVRARRRNLLPDEIARVGGCMITSLARTWVDLAECLAPADLIAAGDSALRSGASEQELAIVLDRAVHRRGVCRARAALPLLDARARSRPESHLRYAIVGAGLPAPAVNAAIYSMHGEWLAEPDLSYQDIRLALEYNGADHADERRMRRDITRELDMRRRGGWETLVFGPAQVFGRPDEIGLMVRDVRRQRLAIIC